MDKYLEENICILNDYQERVEEIHKLSSLLVKYCEAYPENDDLYEISAIAEVICEKLNSFGQDIYSNIHRHDVPESFDTLAERLKNMEKILKKSKISDNS